MDQSFFKTLGFAQCQIYASLLTFLKNPLSALILLLQKDWASEEEEDFILQLLLTPPQVKVWGFLCFGG